VFGGLALREDESVDVDFHGSEQLSWLNCNASMMIVVVSIMEFLALFTNRNGWFKTSQSTQDPKTGTIDAYTIFPYVSSCVHQLQKTKDEERLFSLGERLVSLILHTSWKGRFVHLTDSFDHVVSHHLESLRPMPHG
jgi:hypothetical protein